jgi:radical SAM protein with 4Fe4S-binding SPASM domain
MYIDINGNIYPCLAYCEEKTNIIGNIFNINDIMFKKHICKFEKCPCVWEAQKTTIQQYIKNKNKKYIL